MDIIKINQRYEKQKHIVNKIPIIALTANVLTTDKVRCMAAGVNDHLSKPFKQQDLVDVLNRLWKSSNV